jgi:FtsZ-binding cell division protein ZapB
LQQEVRDIEGQLEEAEVRQREELRKQSKQWQQKLKDLQTTYEQDALDRPHKTT